MATINILSSPSSSTSQTIETLHKRLVECEIMLGIREPIVDVSAAIESAALAAGFDVDALEKAVYQLNKHADTPVTPIPHESLRFINYADLVAGPAAGHYIVMAGPLNFTTSAQVFALSPVQKQCQLIALSTNSSSLTVGPMVGDAPGAPWWIAGETNGWQNYGPTTTPLHQGIYVQGVPEAVARLAFYVKI
jgi:hypothetical protein